MNMPSTGAGHLVLLGAGHTHVHVLQGLAQHRPAGLTITVVSPSTRLLYSGMTPGFVAGHYALDECAIALQQLLVGSAARLITSSALALDAAAKIVTLASGETLAYDWLSLNTGPVMDREKIETQLPGAREHALFVRPIEAFTQLWPRALELARQRPVHLAVVGAGAAGMELAMAAAHAFSGPSCAPGCRVTLVAGKAPLATSYPAGVERRLRNALQRLRIELLQGDCVDVSAGEILLAGGQRLACDAPLLAIGTQAPTWLAGSSLSLDAAGFVSVNRFQQSISHANVFAAGDIASRVDAPHARSGVYAVRAGPPLLANLRAAIQGKALTPCQPQKRTLKLVSCGARYAIAIWGGISVEGAWVWRWKERIDRRFVAAYSG